MFTLVFFQALAQNSELRERLCKIHAESHIVEPTLINASAPVQVGAGMQWLFSPLHHPPPPLSPTILMIIIISIFILHPTQSRICHRMNELSFPLHPDSTNLSLLSPQLTSFYKDNNYRISFRAHFEGTLPPQISCKSVLIFEKVLPLNPVHYHTAEGNTSNYLPHYRLLNEALCSLNQICWPQRVNWST